MSKSALHKIELVLVMAGFGCLGPIVRAISFPASATAMFRAWSAAIALIIFMLIFRRGKVTKDDFRRAFWPMVASGVFLAIDWIGLFMAYNHTTVATATVVYYIAPILVLIASPFVLRERFTLVHLICVLVAFGGMVLVSGIIGSGGANAFNPLGIGLALFGALGYMGVILINKKFTEGDPVLRTTIQISVAAIISLPYVLITEDITKFDFNLQNILLVLLLGVGFTAMLYIVYFRLVVLVPARNVVIFSYADAVMAVFCSLVILHEQFALISVVGAALIIGSAIASEFFESKGKKEKDLEEKDVNKTN